MSEIKQKLLKYELARIGFPDAEYKPLSDKIKVQPKDSRMPDINDAGDIHYGTEHSRFVTNTLLPIVERVNEAVAAWERSEAVPFEELSQFKVLNEYNRIILAARDDTEHGRGLHYVTWQYNYDRTGVEHGHYTEDYNAAKEDFAERSGLISGEKLFTPEQAAEIKAAVEYRIENDGDLTYTTENALNEIAAKVRDAYPEKEPREKTERETGIPPDSDITTVSAKENGEIADTLIPDITVENIPTSTTILGEAQPGDWVIAAGNDVYRYLLGTVTAIEKLGSTEHDTENETDDIHVDFTAFDYPPERIAEIEEHFSDLYGEPKTFDELPLDNVIMPPETLICITHLGYDEIIRMGNDLHNCKAFCNCFPGAGADKQYNARHAELMERLNQNLNDYHDMLDGFGNRELIDMAEKIAAMSGVHSYMCHCGFDYDELDFLLQFQNPLEIAVEGWLEYQFDIDNEMGFALDNVFRHKQDWLESQPLMSGIEPPADLNLPRYNEIYPKKEAEPFVENLCDKHITAEQSVTKQKTLEEKLNAAKEKVKTQETKENDKETKKREERS